MYIYYLPITKIEWTAVDKELMKYVSSTRWKKILKYRYIPDQKSSLYTALLTRMGISQLMGIPAQKLQFSSIPNHKPFLLSASCIDFSFSHTRNSILCYISDHASVGADIEKIKKAPLEIMTRIFHPEEIKHILESSTVHRDLYFYKKWTYKEAYTKQTGIGLVQDLRACNTLLYLPNFFT